MTRVLTEVDVASVRETVLGKINASRKGSIDERAQPLEGAWAILLLQAVIPLLVSLTGSGEIATGLW